MKTLEKFEKPRVPADWNYDDSVNKVKAVIYKWKSLTIDMLTELWIAREKLSGPAEKAGTLVPGLKTWTDYCEEIGSSRQVVNRWLSAFSSGSDKVLLSQSHHWYTPKKYIEAVKQVMGDIDLDPCSCNEANQTVDAKKFYSENEDGLLQKWEGRIFLNPPYGDLSKHFIEKFFNDFGSSFDEGIILVNSRATDADWFQPLFEGVICFTDHRIDFDCPDEKDTSSTHGSCFVYFGKNDKKFAEAFSQFGNIVKKWPQS